MPEYLSPGVYVEEIDAGPQPIAAVATSTAGAVGVTREGPITPQLITSYGDFLRLYGGPLDIPDEATQSVWDDDGQYWHAAESVKAFFDEGGARMYFQRVQPGGAVASSRAFNGGLFALVQTDVAPTSTTIGLSHVVGIANGNTLDVVSDDGSVLGTVTVASVNYRDKSIGLSAAAGFAAPRGQALAVILPVDTTLAVLTIEAASAGVWGDDLSVRLLPSVGARLSLGASSISGAPVPTTTTADAAAGATSITVAPVTGLDTTTPPGFSVRVGTGDAVAVSGVAAAGANVTLTLASALAAVVRSGTRVLKLRPAANAAVLAVSGADRLYPEALVQLEGAAGAEIRTVVVGRGRHGDAERQPRQHLLRRRVAERRRGRPHRALPAARRRRGDRADRGPAADQRRAPRLVRPPGQREVPVGPRPGGRRLRRHGPAGVPGGLHWAVGDARRRRRRAGEPRRRRLRRREPRPRAAHRHPGAGGHRPGRDLRSSPGMWSVDVRSALIVHCETLADRFAILDPPPGLGVQEVEAFRSPIDTKYAALYYPWVQDPRPAPGR